MCFFYLRFHSLPLDTRSLLSCRCLSIPLLDSNHTFLPLTNFVRAFFCIVIVLRETSLDVARLSQCVVIQNRNHAHTSTYIRVSTPRRFHTRTHRSTSFIISLFLSLSLSTHPPTPSSCRLLVLAVHHRFVFCLHLCKRTPSLSLCSFSLSLSLSVELL